MKATYLRIKDSVISVTDQQKPDSEESPITHLAWMEATAGTRSFEKWIESKHEAFSDSFIEVSNKQETARMIADMNNKGIFKPEAGLYFGQDGLYPIDGLEFELKSISDRKTGREETFSVYQVAILSLSNSEKWGAPEPPYLPPTPEVPPAKQVQGAEEYIMERYNIQRRHLPNEDLTFSGNELIDLVNGYTYQSRHQAWNDGIQECVNELKRHYPEGTTNYLFPMLEKLKK